MRAEWPQEAGAQGRLGRLHSRRAENLKRWPGVKVYGDNPNTEGTEAGGLQFPG